MTSQLICTEIGPKSPVAGLIYVAGTRWTPST